MKHRQKAKGWWIGFVCLAWLVGCATTPSVPRQIAEPLLLPAPSQSEFRSYLGLSPQTQQVDLQRLPGRVLVVAVFDVYCTICQYCAPKLNKLYDSIQAKPYASQVRMVGVGFKDTPLEVSAYQQRYKIRFPLLADTSGVVCKRLGVDHTPTFLVFQREQGRLNLLFHHVGAMRSAEMDRVLQLIQSAVGGVSRQTQPKK